jgi:hypothetical protein
MSETATPTETPTPTPEPGPAVITVENISQLTMVDQMGQGDYYGSAISPDNNILAVSTSSGVYLYNVNSKALEKKIDFPDPVFDSTVLNCSIYCQLLSFSPDGKYLAFGVDEIVVWNLVENKVEAIIANKIADFSLTEITFAPNGTTILIKSDGYTSDCSLFATNYSFVDFETGQTIYQENECNYLFSPAFYFIKNNRVILTTSDYSKEHNSRANFIDLETGQVVDTKYYQKNPTSFNSDGTRLTFNSFETEWTTQIIDVSTGNVISTVPVYSTYLPSGNDLINETSIVAENGTTICSFSEKYNFFRIRNDESRFEDRSGDMIPLWNWDDYRIEILKLKTCEIEPFIAIPMSSGNWMKVSSDGKYLAVNGENYVYIWDIEKRKFLSSIPFHLVDIDENSSGFVGNSTQFYARNDEKTNTLIFWDFISQKQTRTITFDFSIDRDPTVSPNGQYLGFISGNKISIWDLNSGMNISTLNRNPYNIAFLTDDGKIGLRYAQEIDVYDIHTSVTIDQFSYLNVNTIIGLSRDMTLLAYPVDLTLTIYDFQSKSKTILEQPSDLRDGFKSSYELSEISPAYQFLRFDPNNSYLVALYFQPPLNYILRFWDLRTKKVIRDISIPFSVDDIQLAPDGKSIYLLSDGLVRILQIKQ